MLVIRLSRTGKKNAPSYRIVVAEKARAVKGKKLEVLGFYIPITEPKQFSCNKEKVLHYLKNGAQLSPTARNLLCDHGILPKNQKIKIVYGRKKTVTEDPKKPSVELKDDSKDKSADAKIVEAEIAEKETTPKVEPVKSETEAEENQIEPDINPEENSTEK